MWQEIQQPFLLLALGLVMLLSPQALAEERVNDIDHAWVKLFDTRDYQGERLSINYPRTVRDLRNMDVDRSRDRDRDRGGNNIASSAHYAIPRGWALRLYTQPNFEGDSIDLRGTGRAERRVLPMGMNNKITSVRWVRLDNYRDSDDGDFRWERRRERVRD
jgi:hypothetical protein